MANVWVRNWQQDASPRRDWTVNLQSLITGQKLERCHVNISALSTPQGGGVQRDGKLDRLLVALTWTEGNPEPVPVDVRGHFTGEDYLWYTMFHGRNMHDTTSGAYVMFPWPHLEIDTKSDRTVELGSGTVWLQAAVLTPLGANTIPYTLMYSFSILFDDGT